MRRILIAFVLIGLGAFAWLWARDARLDRLANEMQSLTRAVRSLVEERSMADVNLSDGDPALDHAVTAGPWTSSSQTVQVTVYKGSANETPAQFRTRYLDAVGKAMTTYPPNTQ